MTLRKKAPVPITSEDLESKLSIPERPSGISKGGGIQEYGAFPTKSRIFELIDAGETAMIRRAALDVLDRDPENIGAIEALALICTGDHANLIKLDLLLQNPDDGGVLAEVLRHEFDSYKTPRIPDLESLTIRLGSIHILRTEEGCKKFTNLFHALVEEYYRDDPILARDLALSLFRVISKHQPKSALIFLGGIRQNLTDQRIWRSGVLAAKRSGDLFSALELCSRIDDGEFAGYEQSVTKRRLLRILTEGDKGEIEGLVSNISFPNKEADQSDGVVHLLSRWSLVVNKYLDVYDSNSSSDTWSEVLSLRSWLSDSHPGRSILEWEFLLHSRESEEGHAAQFLKSGEVEALVVEYGGISEDLEELPLADIGRRLAYGLEISNFDVLLDSITVTLDKIGWSTRRAAEIVHAFTTQNFKTRAEDCAELIAVSRRNGLSSGRLTRVHARALEWGGEPEAALALLENEDSGSNESLRDGIALRWRLRVKGINIEVSSGELVDQYPNSDSILYCVHSALPFVTSGYTVRTREISTELKKCGLEVAICVRSGFPMDREDLLIQDSVEREFEVNGITHYFDSEGMKLNFDRIEDYILSFSEHIIRCAMERRPSTIVAASDHVVGLSAAIAAKRLGIPFIYEMRGIWALSRAANNPGFELDPRFGAMMNLEKQCAEVADRVLAISAPMRDLLIEWGIQPGKISLALNGSFSPAPSGTHLDERQVGGEGQIRLGYVGSLVDYEGIDLLIETLASMKESEKNSVSLTIAGDGKSRKDLENRASLLDLGDLVRFKGLIPNEEIGEIYDQIDLIVTPRKAVDVCEIVTPMKTIEAMSRGIPILGSDVGGIESQVVHGQTGILFKKGSQRSLKYHLRKVISGDYDLASIGKQAQDWVLAEQTWGCTAREVAAAMTTSRIMAETQISNQPSVVRDIIGDAVWISDPDDVQIMHNQIESSSLFIGSGLANLRVGFIRGLGDIDSDLAVHYATCQEGEINDPRFIRSAVTFCNRSRRYDIASYWLEQHPEGDWKGAMRETLESRLSALEYYSTSGSDDLEIKYLKFNGYEILGSEAGDSLLLYADVDLNVIDGSSIWVHSMASMLSGLGFQVDILSKCNIERDLIVSGINGLDDVRIITPSDFGLPKGNFGGHRALDAIEALDGIFGCYRRIVLRGLDICLSSLSRKSLRGRILAYLTDYYVINGSERELKEQFVENSMDLANFIAGFLVQTSRIGEELQRVSGIQHSRIHLVPPAVPEPSFKEDQRKTERIQICYAGKIAPQWGVLELIVGVERMGLQDKVEIHIIGDKIHDGDVDGHSFRDLISETMENADFVTTHGGLSREDALGLVSSMDVAWAFREPTFEQLTMERSTKLLEYISMGIPVILTRSALNEEIVGRNYPLLLDSIDDIGPVLQHIAQQGGVDFDSSYLSEMAADYTFGKVRENLITPLVEDIESEMTAVPRRILLNGHDLKFISEYESDLKRRGHIVRRDRWAWGDPRDLDRSIKLLEWADEIFSEWGLKNAVWFSTHSFESNKNHVVRIHLQEVNARAAKYTEEIDLRGVDRIVFVAEHIRKQAISMFDWPGEVTTVVSNYVDLDMFPPSTRKSTGKKLGIVGIVPQRKRFDIALNVLRHLNEVDDGWELVVKGRMPRDYPFMRAPNRAEEMEFFDRQFKRIRDDPLLAENVTLVGHTPTLGSFYEQVDFILSPSDFESFHFSIAEGVASGSLPVIWNWKGASSIYPSSWVVTDEDKAVRRILDQYSRGGLEGIRVENRRYIEQRFSMKNKFEELDRVILSE